MPNNFQLLVKCHLSKVAEGFQILPYSSLNKVAEPLQLLANCALNKFAEHRRNKFAQHRLNKFVERYLSKFASGLQRSADYHLSTIAEGLSQVLEGCRLSKVTKCLEHPIIVLEEDNRTLLAIRVSPDL